jgi:hypothetical protein
MTFARIFAMCLTMTAACTVGSLGGDDPGGGGGGGGGGTGNPDPATGKISGTITSDQSWSGTITITGNTTIAASATVTVAPGTMIEGKEGATVHVAGTLDIAGAKDAKVTILPVQGTPTWPGFVADSGGTVSMTHVMGTNIATLVYCHAGATCSLDHVEFSSMGNAVVAEGKATITASRLTQVANGGITIQKGDLTVVDSYVLTSEGDIIVMTGGKLDVSYSEIGDAHGSYEHCDFHINSADKVSITHSNIRNGVYGMMIGGTTNAIIQYDNFIANATFDASGKRTDGADLDPIGSNNAPDFQHSYFDRGAPTTTSALPGAVFTTPMPPKVADAGPRAANL